MLNVSALCSRNDFKVYMYFQVSESTVLPLEKDYGLLSLTAHRTGIGRSRERGHWSGECAPSMRVMPSHQGFQFTLFVYYGRSRQIESVAPSLGLRCYKHSLFTRYSYLVCSGKTVYLHWKPFPSLHEWLEREKTQCNMQVYFGQYVLFIWVQWWHHGGFQTEDCTVFNVKFEERLKTA